MGETPRIRFLGTGAGGGTPGAGRSQRRESCALVLGADTTILVDVGGDIDPTETQLKRCDAVVLTHGHSDAIGGLAALGRVRPADAAPVLVYALPATIAAAERRFAQLQHCDFRPFRPGDRARVGGWTLSCLKVPHASNPIRFPTVAWKLTNSGRRLVYASDVARLTSRLRKFSRGAGLLVLDGATYHRSIFSHLRIDEHVPQVCRWPVDRILLTQIGRSAPPHDELALVVSELCERAAPAYDGLEIALP